MSPEIVGLGYCGLDYISVVPYIPADSKVEIMSFMTRGGGPSATAVVAAARLGAEAAFMGVVGNDERGRLISEELEREGVDVSGLKVREGCESPAAFCWVESDTGKRSIAWTRGNSRPLQSSEIDLEMINSAKALHLDGHHAEAALAAAQTASRNGVTVSLDAGTVLPGIESLMGMSDIIIASREFASAFTREPEPEKAVKKMFGGRCSFSAVTMGSTGAVGYDGKRVIKQPAFEVDAVDTTGAGDVFHGAFVYKYVKGGGWAECMQFAAAAAALKTGVFGGRAGSPSLNETEKFIRESRMPV